MKTAVALVALCGLVAAALAAVPGAPGARAPRGTRGYAQPCPACDKRRIPVCATDGYGHNKTFLNKCMIEYGNCEDDSDFAYKSEGECPDDPLVWQYDENEAFDPVEAALE